MRVLVFGGRTFSDAGLAANVLRRLRPEISVLIHGDARGADRIARDWARRNGVPENAFPALWALHGLAAGPLRNQQMIDEGQPDLGVEFPGRRGTADMLKRLRSAEVGVIRVYEHGLTEFLGDAVKWKGLFE